MQQLCLGQTVKPVGSCLQLVSYTSGVAIRQPHSSRRTAANEHRSALRQDLSKELVSLDVHGQGSDPSVRPGAKTACSVGGCRMMHGWM